MPISNFLLRGAVCAVCVPCALCALPALAAAPRYGVTIIDTVPGKASVAALNNAGTVVGARYDAARGAWGAYAWSAGQISMLPEQMASVRAISNAGHIAGVSPLYEDGGYQQMMSFGMLYYQGTMRGVPDALQPDYSTGRWYSFTSPLGVNSAGTLLVQQETNAGSGIYLAQGDDTSLLPMWQGAAINESGQVVGGARFDNETATRAVLYSNGQVLDLGTLAGGSNSYARDLNDYGVVVGSSDVGTAQAVHGHSFIWRDGVMQAIGSLAMENSAQAVNNHGDVVGTFATGGSGLDSRHSYLFRDGVQYDLQTLLAGGGGWRITDVVDINDSGQIAGQACDAAGRCFAALLVPVPEPGSWGMLLAGLAVVGAVRLGGLRRRAA